MLFDHTPWYIKVLVSYIFADMLAIQGFLIIIYYNTMENVLEQDMIIMGLHYVFLKS